MLSTPSTSFLILRLWRCGNRALQAKLAYGVTHIRLRQLPALNSVWPRMLSSFHNLRSLHLTASNGFSEGPNTVYSELVKLPETLETLDILVPNILSCFELSEDGRPQYPPIRDLFPRLKSLSFLEAPKFGSQSRKQVWNWTNFLAQLPSSLTSLSLPDLRFAAPSCSFMSLLPRSLVTLDTCVLLDVDSQVLLADVNQAPTSLTQIRNVEQVREGYPHLPKSLTSVSMSGGFWDEFTSTMAPPHLANLVIAQMDIESFGSSLWTASLPARLTTLSLFVESIKLNVSLIGSLPRTITCLQGNQTPLFDWLDLKRGQEDGSLAESWPPDLQTLRCLGPVFDTICLSFLPDTIKTLTFGKYHIPSADDRPGDSLLAPKYLPRSLTRWDQGTADHSQSSSQTLDFTFGDACTSADFPPGLEAVRLSSYTSSQRLGRLECLPDSVTDLHLAFEAVKYDKRYEKIHKERRAALATPELWTDCPWDFPPHLKQLTMSLWRRDWFAAVPKTVTIFSSNLLYGMKKAPSHTDLFEELPSGLIELQIGSDDATSDDMFSSRCFSALPHLTILNVPWTETYPSMVLRSVSRDLIILKIQLKSLEVDDAAFLPRGLVSARFQPKIFENVNLWPILQYYPPLARSEFFVEHYKRYQSLLQIASDYHNS